MPQDGIKFVHCADIHIDRPFCDRDFAGYSESRSRDVRKTFEDIIALARAEKADLLLICGDMYSHNYTNRASIEWIRDLLGSLPATVVVIPGNHDPFVANSWYRILDWPDNVIILTDESPSVTLRSLNTFIYGIGFSAFRQDKPDLSRVARPIPGFFNIFMLHGELDTDVGDIPYNPVTSGELENLGYDYYALGHFHNASQSLRLRNAAYAGSPEPLGFGEPGCHGVILGRMWRDEVGSVKVEAAARHMAQKRYVEIATDISACERTDEVVARIGSALNDYDGERDLVKLYLRGRPGCPVDVSYLEGLFPDHRYLKVINETRQRFDYEALARENTLKGEFVREMLAKINSLGDGESEEEKMLNAALDLGIEALETGSISVDFE